MKQKQWWKRFVALALGVVLVVPMSMGFAGNADASEVNLITNGKFDDENGALNESGWTPKAATAEKEMQDILQSGNFSTSAVFSVIGSGATAVRDTTTDNPFLKITTTVSSSVYLQKLLTVEAGKTYVVSYQIRIPVDATNIQVQPKAFYATTNTNDEGTVHTSTDGEWISGKFECSVPTGETSMRLRFFVQGYTGEAFHLDDVMVSYATETDKTETINHIPNADFSDSTLNWELANGTQGNLSLENGAMKLIPTNGGFWVKCSEDIAVKQDVTYSIAFYLTGTASSLTGMTTRVYPKITEKKADGTEIKTLHFELSLSAPLNPGRKVTANTTYTPSEGTSYVEFKIQLANPIENEVVTIDNLEFISTETVYSDGIILNGSDHEMKLSNGNSAVYTENMLTSNCYYDYSYAVKNSGLTKAGLKVGNNIITVTTGTFKYEGGDIGFATEGTGTAYFDDLVISEHANHADQNEDRRCDYCGVYIPKMVQLENASFATELQGTKTVIPGWNVSNNKIAYGDLETEDLKWALRPSVAGQEIGDTTLEIVPDPDNQNNHLLKLTRNETKNEKVWLTYSSNVTVKPNTEYVLTYRHRGGTGDFSLLRIYPGLKLFQEETNTETELRNDNASTRGPRGAWQTEESTFTTGANDSQALGRIYIQVNAAAAGTTWYIDDIQLYEKKEAELTLVASESGAMLSGRDDYYVEQITETLQEKSTYIMNLAGSSDIETIKVSSGVSKHEMRENEIALNKNCLIPTSDAGPYVLRIHTSDSPLTLSGISMRLNVGDFNNDGLWSAVEFASMRAAIVGNDVDETVLGDLNGDGATTPQDIIRMKRYELGLN